MVINTEIDSIIVEIEDNEYEVAPKTVAIAEKIIKAEKDFVGQPEYKLWLATLEILLGKESCKILFKSGKNENLDRIERIYKGVLKAFSHNSDELEEESRAERLDGISERIKPITELLKQANKMNSSEQKTEEKNIIRRT